MFYCEKSFQEVCCFLNVGILPQRVVKWGLLSEIKKRLEIKNC
jgi:hypothetical protein